ncbi:AbfB domain-containing protein [Kineosporia sp. J2-2]|uniref:AbfB domain-containing protein n=1 Tax=Kineosporia corallincola TaxID=2835133 RepID=A0ABS5TKG6_9ACTN|nr:alpha-L-arabinofuranosidase B [Kineosporia corallincola]MBT0771597.1 AbfB domain-containing protein [Kineosporia corallincola]
MRSPERPRSARGARLPRRTGLLMAAALLAAAGLTLPTTGAQAATTQPCDLYATGGTPCVAAHSTTRALYGAFTGSLYQVRRASDGTTLDVKPLAAGGVANAASQDTFCSGTTCLITKIYDQSGRGNVLTQAPPGGFQGPDVNGYDNLAGADAAPVTVGGQKAYGVFVSPGTGYRNNNTSGIATGDQAEGMYAVLDGTHYNGGCCFDYGNAETSSLDTGNGHMEAIYFGNSTAWGSGSGSGPWIMADLENGLFSGVSAGNNANDPTVTHRFLTAVVKGRANQWALRGGNAQSGALSTYYEGVRPSVSGYNPMSKEGAIILGIGGDNSVSAQGTFYEGVMTSGYPTAATENAVQANITAAGYQTRAITSGTKPTVGSAVSLRATTSGSTDRYISHSGTTVTAAQVGSSSSSAARGQATWTVRAGLANSECVSFESKDTAGSYLRHSDFQLSLGVNNGSTLFAQDATFCQQSGKNGQGTTFRSFNYPTRDIRHYEYNLYIAANGGVHTFDAASLWPDDVSWVVAAGLAS